MTSEEAPSGEIGQNNTKAAPIIRHLAIKRFRGIRELSWWPDAGVNLVLGGGDVGKTTILDAIGLLLSPTNGVSLTDTDYHQRNLSAGFEIEAVFSLPLDAGMSEQSKMSWPWRWNGTEAVIPSEDDEGAENGDPVYRLRVRGTEELEVVFEILQPDDTADHLSVAMRRAIGLVRVAGDDRSDRDLRLVQGSALDRLLSDKTLRSRIGSQLAKTDVRDQLGDDARRALQELDAAFSSLSLPSGLDLSITGGPGASVASMIGLTASREEIQLPLASWGAGTRRLSALAIAAQNQGPHPITLVDEIERGLEPYRQRDLLRKLQAAASQVFVTTHSPAAIAAATDSAMWYVDHAGAIGRLDHTKTAKHRAKDPDTFLSRLAVICEGSTEVGFVTELLNRAVGRSLLEHGIHVSDGDGHDTMLPLLEALCEGGVRFGGFADDEARHPQRWQRVKDSQGDLLFRWEVGCIEENLIGAVPEDSLESFIGDPEGKKTGMRLRTLADRLGIQDKNLASIRAAAGDGLKRLVIEAAMGKIPDNCSPDDESALSSHARTWFKSVAGGRELAAKMFSFELWPAFRPRLLPFCNAVRGAVGLPAVEDLPP